MRLLSAFTVASLLIPALAACSPVQVASPTPTLDPDLTSDPGGLLTPTSATLQPTATVRFRDPPSTAAFDACLLMTPIEVNHAITPYNPSTFGQPPDPDRLPVPVSGFEFDPQRGSVTGTCDYGRLILTVFLPGPYDDLRALVAAAQVGGGFEPQGEETDTFGSYWSDEQATLHFMDDDRWLTIQVLSPSRNRPDPRAEYNAIIPLVYNTFSRIHDVLASVYPSPTPYFNACDVLAVDQAESILGPLADDPVFSAAIGEDVGPVEECVYNGERNVAVVQMQRWSTPEDASGSFAYWTGRVGEALAGIGDEALWDAALLRLSVRRDTVTFYVTMSLPDGARNQAILIAQIAVVRIP